MLSMFEINLGFSKFYKYRWGVSSMFDSLNKSTLSTVLSDVCLAYFCISTCSYAKRMNERKGGKLILLVNVSSGFVWKVTDG